MFSEHEAIDVNTRANVLVSQLQLLPANKQLSASIRMRYSIDVYSGYLFASNTFQIETHKQKKIHFQRWEFPWQRYMWFGVCIVLPEDTRGDGRGHRKLEAKIKLLLEIFIGTGLSAPWALLAQPASWCRSECCGSDARERYFSFAIHALGHSHQPIAAASNTK